MKSSRTIVIVAVVIVLLLLVPWRGVVAPEWTITLTDESGKPMSGILLQQTSQDYSLEGSPQQLVMISDAHGRVVFPLRARYASPVRRFLGCVNQGRRFAYHASCGPHTWVVVTYPEGYGQNDEREFEQARLSYDGGTATRAETVVVHKCRNGGTGITCFAPSYHRGSTRWTDVPSSLPLANLGPKINQPPISRWLSWLRAKS